MVKNKRGREGSAPQPWSATSTLGRETGVAPVSGGKIGVTPVPPVWLSDLAHPHTREFCMLLRAFCPRAWLLLVCPSTSPHSASAGPVRAHGSSSATGTSIAFNPTDYVPSEAKSWRLGIARLAEDGMFISARLFAPARSNISFCMAPRMPMDGQNAVRFGTDGPDG